MGSSRKLFFGAILGTLINTAIVLANAFLIAAIIVGIIYHHPTVVERIIELGCLWIFRSIFTSQFDRWASDRASELKAQLRAKVLTSREVVLGSSPSHLSTLLVKGANSLDIYLARFLPQMFGASFTPFVVIAAIAFQDLTSAVIATLTLPIIPIFGALIGKFTSDAVTAKWQSLGTLAKYFEDSLRGIFTLAIFGRHKSQGARIQEMGDRYTDETMKVLRISFLSALVLELASTISVALIAVSIGIRLVHSSMEFFPALVVLVLAPEVYFPLRNAASLFHASADGGAALSSLSSIGEEFPEKRSEGQKKLDRVSALSWGDWKSPFGSGELPATSLQSGDICIIRGGSGLGKTTFLNSLLGFNESNDIRINSAEIAEYERRSLFAAIGWIPQSPTLIAGNVRELFLLVDESLTDTAIKNLLTRVGLSLGELPDGLATRISGSGEKSGNISGGQKRRLAIARALAINPSLIIADEPTADLDPRSAQDILAILRECAAQGAIVIAVLHAPDHRIDCAVEIEMVQR
jgi:ABC-type transport system involved in cytochrome bd biosynthesis fused ATPase/permease subunit